MLKHLYKVMGLVIVFAAALWFFGKYIEEINVYTPGNTVEAKGETYPVLYISSSGKDMNRLYGYSSNIPVSMMRESITVLDDSKLFGVNIREYGTAINKLNYEVRSCDTGELMDSGSVSALTNEDDMRVCNIKPDCEFETSKEYSLKITLITSVSRKIDYYTRIKYYPEECHVPEKIDFVMNFHNMTINKDENAATYIEPSAAADNTTLAYVDIHSSFANVTWGSLTPSVITDIIPTVKEINIETAAVQLVYYATAETDAGTETFYVKEYYRIKYTSGRMYLLWYERTMESMLDVSLSSLNKSELNMGITSDTDMQIVVNDAGTRVSFEKFGDVYMYDLAENKLNRIYSQYFEQDISERKLYRQQDARIISMDEEGNVTFAVYGYISHGGYEGKVAVILYRYHVSDNALEELVYIPFETPYQLLKENFDKYCYINGKDVFYFVIDGRIYSYDIVADKLTLITEDAGDGHFTIIKDSNIFAWEESGGLIVLNLETGKRMDIMPSENQYVRLVGVIGGSIVYGTGKNSDITRTADGTVQYIMQKLDIMNMDGNIVKTYKVKQHYISNAYVKDNVVYIDRVKKKADGSFVSVPSDNIINRLDIKETSVKLTSRVSDKSMTEWYMSFPQSFVMETYPAESVVSKYIINEEHVLYLDEYEKPVKYYVYAKGDIKASFSSPAEAVVYADNEQGVVLNQNNRIVWERGGRFNSKTVSGIEQIKTSRKVDSIDACIYMLLHSRYIQVKPSDIAAKDGGIMDILSQYVSEPLNLCGINLDEALYFVSSGCPVIAMKDGSHAVIITAYTQTGVTIYDPQTGQSQTMYHANADSMFYSAGNIFYSVIKEENK